MTSPPWFLGDPSSAQLVKELTNESLFLGDDLWEEDDKSGEEETWSSSDNSPTSPTSEDTSLNEVAQTPGSVAENNDGFVLEAVPRGLPPDQTAFLNSCQSAIGILARQLAEIRNQHDAIRVALSQLTQQQQQQITPPTAPQPTPTITNPTTRPFITIDLDTIAHVWYRAVKHSQVTVRLRPSGGSELPGALRLAAERGEVSVRIKVKDSGGRVLSEEQQLALFGAPTSTVMRVQHDGTTDTLVGSFDDLRFHCVSKNYGGHIFISTELTADIKLLQGVRVEVREYPMKIHSKRRVPGKPIEKVEPNDRLADIAGFGPTYGTKLAELGIATVRDLVNKVPLTRKCGPETSQFDKQYKEFVPSDELSALLCRVRKPGGKSEKAFVELFRAIHRRHHKLKKEGVLDGLC